LIQAFAGRGDGDADDLPVTEGIRFHFFPSSPRRLVMCPWACGPGSYEAEALRGLARVTAAAG
jgi:hypothetical protein